MVNLSKLQLSLHLRLAGNWRHRLYLPTYRSTTMTNYKLDKTGCHGNRYFESWSLVESFFREQMIEIFLENLFESLMSLLTYIVRCLHFCNPPMYSNKLQNDHVFGTCFNIWHRNIRVLIWSLSRRMIYNFYSVFLLIIMIIFVTIFYSEEYRIYLFITS